MQGAIAVGAAMGWGPGKLLDFIARGAGDAAAAQCDSHRIQRLVVFVAGQGTNGWISLLWPNPDNYVPGRVSTAISNHALQVSASQGATAANFSGSLLNAPDYTQVSKMPKSISGLIPAGQPYAFYYGVGNTPFGGFTSTNAQSMAVDKAFWGSSTVPSNVSLPSSKKFMIVNRETPWLEKYGATKAITSLAGGYINPFHINGAHNRWVNYNSGYTVFASAAAIQLAIPSIVPAIMVGDMSTNLVNNTGHYGTAPGAPNAAFVSSAAGMLALFNSNAARAGGALSNPQNAALFEAFTKGFIGNSKTATIPTFAPGLQTAEAGTGLVGLNLAAQLQPTLADQMRYGFTGSNPPKLAEMRDRMITTAKALKLGLTAQVAMTFMGDDPHGAFTAAGTGLTNAACGAGAIGGFLNAFMDDLMSVPDPLCPSLNLGDNTVIAFLGDVPRSQVNNNNWNDPPVGDQNQAWIMSNGRLVSGFFGGDRAQFAGQGPSTNDQNAQGPGESGFYDLNTGDLIPFSGPQSIMINGVSTNMAIPYGETANAAVLYAVSGDMTIVNQFYRGNNFPAIAVPNII